ncbi:MAG: 3-hydroxybutyryl-CoA dehydrogenase [Deltaproteobacteria bacterium]|nr:3-hydroxybutyryl-CoA dehydrogenase [Deltaproteobacteria bacterium]
MGISSVGVVGAGQMGSGIAQVAAVAGLDVVLQDISSDGLSKAKARIEQSLVKLSEKGKLSPADVNAAKGRITTTQHLDDVARAGLVIEAASENPQLKFEIFRKLDGLCGEGTILATNTSSISITTIAAQTKRPEKVVGMHFMNPVPLMKLVEVIRGLRTSDETFRAVKALGEKMEKTCVESKDYPGFVVNRILMPMINEACYALFEGLASVEDIDNAMKLGTNQPMGPLTLADFIGLDTCLAILNVMHEGLGDPKYRPCPLLKQYVSAGLLGKKTGQGFYKYGA